MPVREHSAPTFWKHKQNIIFLGTKTLSSFILIAVSIQETLSVPHRKLESVDIFVHLGDLVSTL